MANRVQTLRSATGGARPAAGTRLAGELYVNWPDKQIGVIDSTQAPLDLVGVRFFSTGASYNVGDYTVQGGELYRATASITPGAFSPAQWDQVLTVANVASTYLPLTGGTLAGPGNLTVNGTAAFGSTISVTGMVTVNNSVNSKGLNASLWTFDRGNSGGNTAQVFGFYRDANIGHIYMDNGSGGDVLSFATTGNATFGHLLTCNAGLGVIGSLNVSGVIGLNGTSNFPLQIATPAGVYPAILTQCAGQHAWYAGAWTDGGYYLYDATASATRLLIDNAGNGSFTGPTFSVNGALYVNAASPLQLGAPNGTNCITYGTVAGVRQWYWGVMTDGTWHLADASAGRLCFNVDVSGNVFVAQNGGEFIAGANGAWSSGGQVFSPYSGGAYATSTYGGGTSGGWAQMVRVDNWATYCLLTNYVGTATGSITSNGTNTFFNTTCDGRRKDNVRELSSEIDVGGLIDELKPVAFEWKFVKETGMNGEDLSVPVRTDHGFVAQDLHKVVPHIVHTTEDDSDLPWMADYSKLVPYLVAELQTLRKRVAELEGRPS
jgi:hypothetical protein